MIAFPSGDDKGHYAAGQVVGQIGDISLIDCIELSDPSDTAIKCCRYVSRQKRKKVPMKYSSGLSERFIPFLLVHVR